MDQDVLASPYKKKKNKPPLILLYVLRSTTPKELSPKPTMDLKNADIFTRTRLLRLENRITNLENKDVHFRYTKNESKKKNVFLYLYSKESCDGKRKKIYLYFIPSVIIFSKKEILSLSNERIVVFI